jgi:predicted acyltransferase
MVGVHIGPQGRLLSLDVFRGATIAGMILVNNPGSWEYVYPQLRHAAWHGWTMTDTIFPFFLWIVGVAMTFSFAKRMEHGEDKNRLLLHSVRRSAIIFALGLLIFGLPGLLFDPAFSFGTLRIPGVLQRIAICYLVVSVICLNAGIRAQVVWMISLLAGYWLLMKLVPVPGYGAGVMDPVGNLCWFIDSSVLAGHTWVYAPAKGFDPEGILSTLPAIATTLAGVLTGHLVRSDRPAVEKTVLMFVSGYFCLLLGAILDMWFPINKNLWSSSFVVFMAGWALVCFATVYWLVDVRGITRWTKPFVVLGMNAIAIYCLSELVSVCLFLAPGTASDGSPTSLYDQIFASWFFPLASPINASLLFAVAFLLLMYAVAWLLYKRKWFMKV